MVRVAGRVAFAAAAWSFLVGSADTKETDAYQLLQEEAAVSEAKSAGVVAEIDRVGLTEARKVFANSQTVAARLLRFNGIRSEPLYHPPPLAGRYRAGKLGDTVLWVGRLDSWKRPGLLLEALPLAPDAARSSGAARPTDSMSTMAPVPPDSRQFDRHRENAPGSSGPRGAA